KNQAAIGSKGWVQFPICASGQPLRGIFDLPGPGSDRGLPQIDAVTQPGGEYDVIIAPDPRGCSRSSEPGPRSNSDREPWPQPATFEIGDCAGLDSLTSSRWRHPP